MNVSRGNVVLLDFPFSGGGGSKVRPALVVQNDHDNRRLTNTIVVMITSRTHRSVEPTQVLVDVTTPEGAQSGLLMTSVVNCSNVFTVERRKLLRLLGSLSSTLMTQVDASLRTALSLP